MSLKLSQRTVEKTLRRLEGTQEITPASFPRVTGSETETVWLPTTPQDPTGPRQDALWS